MCVIIPRIIFIFFPLRYFIVHGTETVLNFLYAIFEAIIIKFPIDIDIIILFRDFIK